MATPIQALTPNQTADQNQAVANSTGVQTSANTSPNTATSPTVISSKDAVTSALNMQGTMNDKTAGMQTQSVNNQAIQQQKTQDQQKQAQDQQKQQQTQQQQQQQNQNQQSEKQNIQNLATAAGYSGNVQYDSQGNIIPESQNQNPQTQNQTTLPSTASIPQGVDVNSQSGQIQFYRQNPDQFNQWTQDQGWNQEQISNVKYQASIQQFNEDAASVKDALNQFAQGTFPLTPDQQSQLDATKQQFEVLINQQKVSNANYENGVRVLGAVTGRAEYFPDIAMGEVQGAINSGLSKVADLTSKETAALATMRQGFEDNNFKEITAAHQMLLSIDTQQTDTIKAVHDSIVSATETAKTDAEKQTMDNWTMYVGQQNLDLATQQKALDNMKFTEQQKMDAQTILDNKTKNNIAWADLALKQATYNATYGSFSNLGVDPKTGQPIVNFKPTDIPGVNQMTNGVNYFDPSAFNDPAQAKAAENIARKAGITILSAKDVPNAQTMTTILSSLAQSQSDFAKIATPNYFGAGPVGVGKSVINGIATNMGYSSQYQQDIQAYNNDRANIIRLATALTGGQTRALAFILDDLNNMMPKAPEPLGTGFLGTGIESGGSFVPTNVADATAKFNSARTIVYQGIKTLIPNSSLPASGDQVFNSTDELLKAHPDRAIQAAKLANQGLLDPDIRAILNY